MFTLASSFSQDQINYSIELNKKYNNEIDSFFGISTDIPFDGGREFFNLPQLSTEQLIKFIKKCNSQGFGFNIVLNTTTIEKNDFNNKKLLSLLENTHSSKNGVIIANHLLNEFIKTQFPKFKRKASRIYNPLTIEEIKQLCNEFDIVTLPEQLNSNKELIKEIPTQKIEIIANSFCFQGCKKTKEHYSSISKLNRESLNPENNKDKLFLDYLNNLGLCEPHTIQSVEKTVIEPKQIKDYINLGVNHYKILDRMNPPTKWLVERYISFASGISFDIKSIPIQKQSNITSS